MMNNIAVRPFNGKYMSFYLITIVKFALSLTIDEIFSIQITCHDLDMENYGQGQGGENWPCAIRWQMPEFFSEC